MTPVYTIEPQDLGLPGKFTHWRPSQYNNIITACETDKRFIALSAPTGSGKSVTGVSIATLMGGRTVILTSTKALQLQYENEGFNGMTDFRGRMNYSCVKGSFSCAEGRILACRDAGCPHAAAKSDFMNSSIGVTNYSCYLSNVIHGEGMGTIDLLILDEAHAAMQELSSALEIRLDHAKATPYYKTVNADSPPVGQPIPQWRRWAGKVAPPLRNYFNSQKTNGHTKGLAELDRLLSDLGRIITLPDTWIIDESISTETTFAPLWPTEYAEKLLFCGVKKILLVSATIVPKTLDLLGIPESERVFLANDYTFDPWRSPVYLFGASRIDSKTSPGQYQEWAGRMDLIISRRLDRKGIIHTVSYDKQQFILSNSEYQRFMFSPRGSALAPTIRSFKEAAPPAILVSPAVTTGYDFPLSDCEYQIISKVPFIDTRPPIMAARVDADPEFASYLTAQNLTQMCGRAMRREDDQCECVAPNTLILKDDLTWVPADSLRVGDRLLAFDEECTDGRFDARKWRWSYVEKARTWKMKRVRVTYEDGEIVCTPNHPWLMSAKRQRTAIWKRADDLKIGDKLIRLLDTWEYPKTYDQGWLSGFCDGEACLVLRHGKRNPNVTGIYICQNHGDTHDKALTLVEQLGFDCFVAKQTKKMRVIRIKGGHSEILKFLGSIRPERLLTKFIESTRGERLKAIAYPRVIRVEEMEDGPITSLQTSTGTFVAEGMGMHNSFILDQHATWFIKPPKYNSQGRNTGGYRHLFPSWFARLIQYPDGQPVPPPPLKRVA